MGFFFSHTQSLSSGLSVFLLAMLVSLINFISAWEINLRFLCRPRNRPACYLVTMTTLMATFKELLWDNVLKSEGTLCSSAAVSPFHTLFSLFKLWVRPSLVRSVRPIIFAIGIQMLNWIIEWSWVCLRVSTAMINKAGWRGKVTVYHWGKSGRNWFRSAAHWFPQPAFLYQLGPPPA